MTKLDTGNRIGPVKEIRAWFALDAKDNKKVNLFSAILQTSNNDPSVDTWVIVPCDTESYYQSLRNIEDTVGFEQSLFKREDDRITFR